MKKKEFWLVIALILFGIFYNSFQKGRRAFYGACSDRKAQLLDDSSHSVSFPQPDIHAPSPGAIQKIIIDNPAGQVEITPSPDGALTIKPIIRVYHKSERNARKIADNIRLRQDVRNNVLDIGVRDNEDFPIRRARLIFRCQVPPHCDIEVKNRFGDTDIQNAGKDVTIQQWNGDLFIKNITGTAHIKAYDGQARLYDIAGPAIITAANVKVKLKNINSLTLKSSHSTVSASEIIENTEINHAGFSHVTLENSGPVSFKGENSSIRLSNIRGKVAITDSNGSIKMDQITGDISINGKHCRIQLFKTFSGILAIKNTFNSVTAEATTADNLDFQLDTARLNITLTELKTNATIHAHSGDMTITLPSASQPRLDISAYQGDIQDTTNSGGEIKKENQKNILKTLTGTPSITITSEYGDIILKKQTAR